MGSLSHGERSTCAPSNPFSTRFIRPGAIGFRFAAGESVSRCVDFLRCHGWRGQVVGPHGSGKSTLLRSLQIPLAECAELRWTQVIPRESGRGWSLVDEPIDHFAEHAARAISKPKIWVIDGFDCLNWFTRGRIQRDARRERAGLLISTHRDLGLPTLHRTGFSPQDFCQLARWLARNFNTHLELDAIRRAYARHRPNVREALFELYDHCENLRLNMATNS